MPRKFTKDPHLASWVQSQRILWNHEYHENDESTCLASYPEPVAVQPFDAGLPNSRDNVNGWGLEVSHEKGSSHPVGVTAEDAALLVATMGEDGMSEMVDAQQAEVVAAAAAAAAEAVDDPPVDEECMKMPAQPKALSQERKDKLDALGFVWRPDDEWDDMYRHLVEYKKKYGDCLVNSRYEENKKLTLWVEK